FFQAEDGIRYRNVTGVQTCALPIFFFYGGHLLLTRATMVEALSEDYIVTARAKGVSQRSILFKHALKNAALPLVTNAALSFGSKIGRASCREGVWIAEGRGTARKTR